MSNTAELIQVLGKDNLTKLQAALGPRMVYIPAQPDPAHPIAQAIGLEAMTTLCAELGCSSTYVGINYHKQRRNRQIIQMVLLGVPTETIARRHGISGKYVRIITQADTQPVAGILARYRRRTVQGLGMEPNERNNEQPNGHNEPPHSRRETGRDATPDHPA